MKVEYNLITRLKYLKGEKAVSAFAEECSVPNSTMSGYIKGKAQPTIDILKNIAEACGKNFGWLATGSRVPFDKDKDSELLRDIFGKDPEVIEIDEESGMPVVKTYDDCDSQLQFYCIHCQQWHYHGRGPDGVPYTLGRGEFAGDRRAHCITKNSPFKETGVILDVVGKYDEKKNNQKDEHALMCPECHSYYSAAFNACVCGYINEDRESEYPEISKVYLEAGGAIILDEELQQIKKKKEIKKNIKTGKEATHTKRINPAPSNISPGPQIRGRVPLISWVQAGDWTEVIDSCNLGEAEDWITTTAIVGPNAFALRVVGNSMEPEFREGEIVTVDPDREAESGAYVIAKINHDEATFKQLIKDGGNVFLRPINDAYPLMDVTGRDLRIVGRVVEKVKRY